MRTTPEASRESLVRRLIDRVLGSTGVLDPALRQSAYADGPLPAPLCRFVHKVHHHAYRVSDEDIAALRAAGYSEDQIFEATLCAAVGAGVARRERVKALLQGGR